ncbi:MAG: CapA family protein, partial [Woeseiaceae bacterium]
MATRSGNRYQSWWWLPLFVVLGACGSTPEVPPAASDSEPSPPIAAKPPNPLKPTQVPIPRPKATFSVAAVGDMMIGTDYPKNHLPDDDAIGFLRAVTPWLSSADVTFGNLEGVLLDGGKPAKECKNL